MALRSSSESDHSEQSSIYWGSDDSESPEPLEFHAPQFNASNPPRLSSPRLFQDFFSNTARVDARLPPVVPQHSHSRPQDFPQAFENVNRAIQTAHQAFQSNQVVDLTNSPPRHPTTPRSPMSHNRARRGASAYEHSPSPAARSSFRTGRSSEVLAIHTHLTSHNSSATGEPAPKRRRIVHGLDTDDEEEGEEEEEITGRATVRQGVEAVDLTEVNDAADLSKALSKQRQDAIQAQMKQYQGSEVAGRTPLTSYKCPICMDTPEDATTTTCGMFRPYSPSSGKYLDHLTDFCQAIYSATSASLTPYAGVRSRGKRNTQMEERKAHVQCVGNS